MWTNLVHVSVEDALGDVRGHEAVNQGVYIGVVLENALYPRAINIDVFDEVSVDGINVIGNGLV